MQDFKSVKWSRINQNGYCSPFREIVFVSIISTKLMLSFPSRVLCINSSDFNNRIGDHCGQEIPDLILVQKIYDVQTLLGVDNVCAIFYLPTNEYRAVTKVDIPLLDGS